MSEQSPPTLSPAAAPPARSPLKQLAKLVVVVLVLGAWGWFLAGQLESLQAYSWEFEPISLLTGTLSAALYFGGLAVGWALLLRHTGQTPAPVRLSRGARVWLLSMITRYVPGNIWHILSRVALAEQLQVSRMRVLASATIEQVITILGALAVVVLTLPGWARLLQAVQAETTIIAMLVLLPLGLLALHPRVFGTLLAWLGKRIKRPELAWSYRYSTILKVLGVYILATALAGLSLAAVLAGLTPVRLADLPLLLGSAALAWTIGYLSFLTPSGLGVREGVLTALLAQVYPLPVAIVGSLLFRLVSTLGELLAVAVSWAHGKLVREV